MVNRIVNLVNELSNLKGSSIISIDIYDGMKKILCTQDFFLELIRDKKFEFKTTVIDSDLLPIETSINIEGIKFFRLWKIEEYEKTFQIQKLQEA